MRSIIVTIFGFLWLAVPAYSTPRVTEWADSGKGSGLQSVNLTAVGGLAVPIGEFGRASGSASGFAMNGPGGGLELWGRFPHDVEIGTEVWIANNKGDGAAFARAIESTIRSLGLAVPPGGYHVSMTAWTSTWGLVSLRYAPRMGRDARAFVAGHFGVVYARGPAMTIVVASPGISSNSGRHAFLGPAAGASLGVRWREHVTVEALYLVGSMEPHGWSPAVKGYAQPIGQLHVAAGYTFRL